MRADRLVATLLVMQARGRVTAAQLAKELEVSVATARRDLEALSTAGIPVYPQPGRGGGWALLGGARTDLSGLTADEARALFLLAGPAAPADPELRSALRKLVRALPETFRADAQVAATATAIDPSRWGGTAPRRPELVSRLNRAIVRGRQIRIGYAGRTGGAPSVRTVDPWGLVDKDGVWYLVAGTPKGERTFRVDRITEVTKTDMPTGRPTDFDLDAAWRRVVDQVEGARGGVHAIVLADPRHVPVLRHRFGRHLVELGPAGHGRVRLRLGAHMARAIAEQLAGWGGLVEVLEPQAVRSELARIGTELVRRYAGIADVLEGR